MQKMQCIFPPHLQGGVDRRSRDGVVAILSFHGFHPRLFNFSIFVANIKKEKHNAIIFAFAQGFRGRASSAYMGRLSHDPPLPRAEESAF